MSIRLKLIIMFLAVAAIPLLFISALTFHNYKDSLEANRFAQLNDLTIFRADRIEAYFAGLKSNIEISQGFYNIKRNLPLLTRLADDPGNQEFIDAKKMLDAQLQQMQSVSDLSDIMLVTPQGRVVYANRPGHFLKDMSKGVDVEQKAFTEGKSRIYFSDVYFDKVEDNRFETLLTAPATDFNGDFIGVIAFEVDMTPVYKLLQDTTGLGNTGEVLVSKKVGNQAEFLNPLRHDPNAALNRRVTFGDASARPAQEAVQGRTGSGLSTDYRGKQVIAAWRYIPSLDWGLVAKIDTEEAFADVTNLRNLSISLLFIIIVLSGITAFSIAHSISEPIKQLSEGAAIIGSGNLDYKIGTRQKDEIGQLSRTFDKMTNDLKQTTASRDELNREIEERKKAEDNIKRNEARLEGLLRISQHHAGSIPELLDFALDEAIALTGSKIGYIYHYNETKKEFTLDTWSKDVMKECTIAEQQTIYQLDKTGIWGEAVRQARPIIVNDFHAPHPLKKGYPEGHSPLYRFLTVPVLTDGHIVGVVGVANKETDYDGSDVTQLTLLMDTAWKIADRKLAEEALRLEQERLDLALKSASMGVWRWEIIEDKRYFDDQTCHLLGINASAFTGAAEEFFRVVNPEYRDKLKMSLARTVEQNMPYESEYEVTWPDGSVHYLTARGRLAGDDAGRPVRINGIIWDITARKQAEEALRTSEQKFASAFASNPAAVAITRLEDGLFLDVNDTWIEMNGYNRDEVIGLSAQKLSMWPSDEARTHFVTELKDKGSLRGWEQEFRRKSGEIFITQLSAKILTVRGEKVVLSTMVDITARKRAEEALRESEQHLLAVFRASPTGLFVTRVADGLYLQTNEVYQRIIGYSADEIIGHSSLELDIWVNPEDRERIVNILREQGRIDNNEIKFRRKNGQIVDLLYSSLPLERGGEHCILGALTDITARKQAEEALRQSEERYRTLFETMLEGFCIVEVVFDAANKPVDYRFLDINPEFERQTGLHNAKGKFMRELAPAHETHWFEIYGKVALTGEPARFENEAKALNRWFDVSAVRVGGPESRKVAILFNDISERKHAEEALQKSHDELEVRVKERTADLDETVSELQKQVEQRIKAEQISKDERQRFYDVLETLPAYVCLLTPDYRMPFANRIFREWFGYEQDKKCYEFLFNRKEPCENCQTYNVLKTNKPQRWEWTGPNDHNYDIYDFPFIDTDGSQLILEMGIDITEQKQAQAELKKYQLHLEDLVKNRTEELSRSNKDLEQFAYVASHDLQEPLRAVSGFVELLRRNLDKSLSEKTNEYMNFSIDGAKRMQSLINGLLEYSRIGTQGRKPQKVNSKEVLDEALARLHASIGESGAKITADDLPTVYFDDMQLMRLFQNLIGNAIKFHSDQPPQIHVSAVRQDTAWRFAVRDNGIGIEPQYAERIFMIFQRLHTRKAYPGTGIGLSICKKIIERHGGKIWVESAQGQGSTFYFTVPDTGETEPYGQS